MFKSCSILGKYLIELDTAKLVKGLLQLRNMPDPDTGLSPAEMLLGRQMRDFIPAKPKPYINSSKDFQEVWKSVADWRELALAPLQQICRLVFRRITFLH